MLEIIPAIDLRGGSCVRLFQGDFARETVFSSNPVDVARQWERFGAARLHVVDLDGARAGEPVQLDLVADMVRAVGIPIQLGGGLRQMEDVTSAFGAGVDRAVLGSAATGDIRNHDARRFRLSCLERYQERIAIGLDAREGKLAVRAWTESTSLDAFAFAQRLHDEGFTRIVYTDISRDGALSGPNVDHIRGLVGIGDLAVIASGGIAKLDDLDALSRAGAEGAIVGQALYSGALDLQEALQRAGADLATR